MIRDPVAQRSSASTTGRGRATPAIPPRRSGRTRFEADALRRRTSPAPTPTTVRSRSTCTSRSAARCAASAAATSWRPTIAPRADALPRPARAGGGAGRGRPARTAGTSRSCTGAAARPPSSTRGSSRAATPSCPPLPRSRRTPSRPSRSTRPSRRDEQIDALAGLGFNRISMGVQDFDARVQEVVGRIQGEKETRGPGRGGAPPRLPRREPRPHLRAAATRRPPRWERTLERILAIHPDRLAVFGFAYVPWAKPHQRLLPQEALPQDRAAGRAVPRRGRGVHRRRATGSSASTTSRSSRTSWPAPSARAT